MKTHLIAATLLAGAIVMMPSVAAAADCSTAAADQAASALRTAHAELMSLPVMQMSTDVDPRSQAAIEGLKDRIEGFVAELMRCAPAKLEAAALQRQITSLVDAVDPPGPSRADRMGDSLAYEVRIIEGRSPLVGVVAHFGIECGRDSMLMLYAREGGVWASVMVRRSRPYRSISGAWEELSYDVSEPDAQGRWFVVTAAVNPWCTSVWQRVRFDVARPGPSPRAPRVLLSRSNTINIEDGVAVEAGRSVFTVRYDGRSVDPDVLTRRVIERYRVTGDRAARIDPIATNARDFVDEWIAASGAQASQWAARTGSGMGVAHEQLSELRRAANTMLTFASVRACKGGLAQIEIASRRYDPVRPGRSWFALVSGDGRYRLEQVSAKPLAGCSGPDLNGQIKSYWNQG